MLEISGGMFSVIYFVQLKKQFTLTSLVCPQAAGEKPKKIQRSFRHGEPAPLVHTGRTKIGDNEQLNRK